jgi:hypothetical protein
MLPELLAIVHRLWAVDEPSVELFSSVFGVALERYDDRPAHFQFYRAQHRLGAIKASFGPNGASVALRIGFALIESQISFPSQFGESGTLVMNPGLSSQNKVFYRMNGRYEMWWGSRPVEVDNVQFRWSFVPKQIYLHNYDHPRSHLIYGPFSTLAREVPADPAHPITLGAYVMEFKRLIGVYASPGGPVFFHENQRFDGPFGSVTVTADDGKYRITKGPLKVEIPYTPRTGLHTNPYDREQADIDLIALMVRGARDRKWWDAYTRPWVL